MSRVTLVCLMATVGIALMVLGASVGKAQFPSLIGGPERVALVYDGDLQKNAGGITLSSWGSGTAESVTDQSYIGPQVLKVKSQGLYQGVVLHLARPIDLQEFMLSPDGYVDLRILPARVPKPKETPEERRQRQQRSGQTTGGRQGARGGGGGGMRGGGGGMRGGGGGGGGGGMRGGGEGSGRGGGMRGGARGSLPEGSTALASMPQY